MAKSKKESKAAAPIPSKPIQAVKGGRVAKAVEKPRAAAKDAAKKVSKKMKKEKKDSSSESSDDEKNDTSSSSSSSDNESEAEVKSVKDQKSSKSPKAAPVKKDIANGADSSSDSGSSSGSDSEKDDAPKANGAAKAVSKDDDDSSSASGDEQDEVPVPKVNGKNGVTSKGDAGSSASSASGSDSGSDSSSEDEVDAKGGAEKIGGNDAADSSDASSSGAEDKIIQTEPLVKKRKAEDTIDQTPKKTKVNVNGEEKEAVANLFIGNLSWNIDEEWLTREFEEFGEISGVRVITDRDSGKSKGFGYVEFAQVDSAIQALEAKNESQLDGRNIRVDFSLPRQPKGDGFTPQQRSSDRAQRYGDTPKDPSSTIFVGNISFNADENMLSDLFQGYGTITAVRMPTDRETGQVKGYGYVDFTTIDEAKGAFEGLQGAELDSRPIRLDYASQRNNSTDSPRGGGRGRGDRGGFGGRGGFSDRGGRGGRGGFDRGRGRGAPRGGRGGTTNRGGFGDFSGKKMTF